MQDRRRWTRRAGMVALALAGMTAACATPPSPAPSGTATPAVPPSSAVPSGPSSSEPAVDGPTPLELVDSGYTAVDDGAGGRAYYAAILRNPNAAWAGANIELEVDFYDAADMFIAGEEPIVNLLPGQTSAVAGQAFGAGASVRFEVNVPDDVTAFVPATAGGAFAVSDVETTAPDGGCVTRGRLSSTFTSPQRFVQLAAVYRNAGGTIVGGASGGIEAVDAGGSARFEIAENVPCADVASTEIFWQVSP